jgi:endonuclease YncB( thermonuclease family)
MRKQHVIKITLLLSVSLLLSCCSKYEKVADGLDFLKYEYFTCDVVRVSDGESFFCQPPDMDMEKIRLIGVSVLAESEKEAKKYCESILRRGTLVKIEPDKEQSKETGDIPAYVFVPGGKMLNVLLLEKGYAEPVKNEVNEKYKDLFAGTEKKETTEETETMEEKPPWLR